MMKTKYDFSISQQVAETMSIEIVDNLGAPRNLSNYSFKLDCRQQAGAEATFFSLSSDEGTIILDTTQTNKVWLVFRHDMTKDLNFDRGLYDLLAYDVSKSHVEVLMTGQVTLNKTVTKLN